VRVESLQRMKKKLEVYIVDSFTDEPFKGNPAGVCLIEEKLDDTNMLMIAKELGLSETAFVQISESNDVCSIRFFSPKIEILLCGHATLAAAKVMFERTSNLKSVSFINIEGLNLEVSKKGNLIEMIFPIYDTIRRRAPMELLSALGIESIENSVYNEETKILLLEIDCSDVLRRLTPKFEALLQSEDSINGVLVTAKSKKENYDFESRYFWPWSGTNEDPVTGGTHTFLAKYWGAK